MLRSYCKKIVITFTIAIFAFQNLLFAAGCVPVKRKPKHEFQKGACYATWTKDRYQSAQSDASLKELAATGTEWVALVVNWYQDRCSSTMISPTEQTPSDESVIHAIKTIHSLGMKVMLKPHLDVIDTSGGSWRGEIGCATEPDWDIWFQNYGEFIEHYARIAQQNKVEILCIGTELMSVATIKEGLWKTKVIAPARAAYKGPLTYAANWDEEYNNVKFWNEMDYVGIDAYFPVSDKKRPTIEEMREGWKQWVKDIETFQAKVNKPIIFPEVGYCSALGSAKTPWEDVSSEPLDLALQAELYQVILETFWNKSWFYGLYWWRWGTDTRVGGAGNKGYSPQRKPAQDVFTKYYKAPSPVKTGN